MSAADRRHNGFRIFRGVHRRIRFRVRQAGNPALPFNLTGCSASWRIGPSYGEPPQLSKATGGQGITIVDPSAGILDVLLTPIDTASLTGGPAGDELVITDPASETDVAAWGRVDVVDLYAA